MMSASFTCMFSMNWFGLGISDPQGAGPDTYSSHWNADNQDGCVPTAQPNRCEIDGQRIIISSNYRPLAGIYSSSGLNAESFTRIDLMLMTLKRECGNCDRGHAQLNA
ncbi:unnamed protein product [Adineta ricciae]|uniref:Uncharacterized protein n=1 Tax=Adineta ricciae TaxID=249248 RepID=A0A814QA19_ADIRI|nr:unnamed protein product [Adineta ricciae]